MKSCSPSSRLRSCEARLVYSSVFVFMIQPPSRRGRRDSSSVTILTAACWRSSLLGGWSILRRNSRGSDTDPHRLRRRRIAFVGNAPERHQDICLRKVSSRLTSGDAVGNHDELSGNTFLAREVADEIHFLTFA